LAEQERLLRFTVPEVREVKAYVLKTKDGKFIARTEEELKEAEEKEKGTLPPK